MDRIRAVPVSGEVALVSILPAAEVLTSSTLLIEDRRWQGTWIRHL